MERHILKTEQKALEINLDDSVYGTFAEIGAGQEVARNFFQAGAAAGTIAKTMSAYDKTYSDAIYGVEDKRRYVCESRVYKMLDHEYGLMTERLSGVRPDTNFFVFADTVSAINYEKTVKGQGWLGIRFQLNPQGKANDLVIHVKMLDNDNRLQQEAIGVLGVNLIYAAYFHRDNMRFLVESLLDGLRGRVKIDLIRLTGPDFIHVDNRLLCLYLVQYGLSNVVIFDTNHQCIHASEFLYKKGLMVVRGTFRPPTLVTLDVFETSFNQFNREPGNQVDNSILITEITLETLAKSGGIDDQDFLDRADMLNALGQKVIISNCSNHQKLINYLTDYKIQQLGLVIGAKELLEIINEKYYENRDGRLLVAFGELFTRNIKIFVYPALSDSGDILSIHNLPVPDGIKFLYKHLIDSEQIVEITGYNPDIWEIFSHKIYEGIQNGDRDWEKLVPEVVVETIKSKGSFNYPMANALSI